MADQTDPQVTEQSKHRDWWRKMFIGPHKRADIISTVITLMLIVVGGVVFAWRLQPPLLPSGDKPVPPKATGCASATRSSGSTAVQPVKVSDASGPTATLSLYISRVAKDQTKDQTQPTTEQTTEQTRQSIPLAIQKTKLCPGEILTASIGDLSRSDGQTLPTNQVAVWGKVDSTGTHVIIWVKANPRYGYVSGFGSYSGIASLNDSHALGGSVPVDIHVLYPNISLVLVFGFLAAFGGFTWAWLVHDLRQESKNSEDLGGQKTDENTFFWRNLILRIAVLLAATIPVVNAQVLANPDWSGDLTQYIALATLAGAAAIALTPTFRVLALRPGLSRDTNEDGR